MTDFLEIDFRNGTCITIFTYPENFKSMPYREVAKKKNKTVNLFLTNLRKMKNELVCIDLAPKLLDPPTPNLAGNLANADRFSLPNFSFLRHQQVAQHVAQKFLRSKFWSFGHCSHINTDIWLKFIVDHFVTTIYDRDKF